MLDLDYIKIVMARMFIYMMFGSGMAAVILLCPVPMWWPCLAVVVASGIAVNALDYLIP